MHRRPPRRLPGFDYLGRRSYSVRFRTAASRPVFTEAPAVAFVLAQLLRAAESSDMAVHAYCFMPDHVHLVLTGRSDAADARQFLLLAKQRSGYAWRRHHGFALWQRYAFERVLRSAGDLEAVTRYVLANPVRANLVTRVQDYPFVGSTTTSLTELLQVFE